MMTVNRTISATARRVLAVTAMVVIAALVVSLGASFATASSAHERHGATLADPSDYRIEAFDDFCFEPDVHNTTDEAKSFAFQLQIGDEYSEVLRREVNPGRLAHLHIFVGYWTPGPEQDRLIELAASAPCTLLVFDET